MDLDNVSPEEREVLERQVRALANSKAKILSTRAELKEAMKAQNALFQRLFPVVRPGRDRNLIAKRIAELQEDSERIKRDISAQEKVLLSSHGENAEPARRSQARLKLDRLKRELSNTHARFERNRALLSPIRLLPAEVLAEIFSLCFESMDPLESTISLTSGPLPITHVCSAWRNIAIKRADLWSIMLVILDNDHGDKSWPSLVKLWLERSRNTPLTLAIRVNYDAAHPVHPQSTFFKILDLFTPHVQRWKKVEIINRSSNLIEFPNKEWLRMLPKDASFPILETIRVVVKEHMEAKEADLITQMLCKAPRLHSVDWIVQPCTALPVLPWSRLVKIALFKPLESHEVLKLLTDCPLLVDLDVTVDMFEIEFHEDVTHRNLRTLYLTPVGILAPLFDKMTLPALQTLTVNELAGQPTWVHNSFMSFLERSKCALQRLGLLEVLPLTTDELLIMLQKLSHSLVSLEIQNNSNRCITDDVLRALTYPGIRFYGGQINPMDAASIERYSKVQILCPNLQELTLMGCVDSTDGALSLMVDTRVYPTEDPMFPYLKRLEKGMFAVHGHAANIDDLERISWFPKSRISYFPYEPDVTY